MAQFAIDEILTTGIQISGFIFDRSYSLGTAGQVLTSTTSGVMWQADSSIVDLSSLSGQIAATGTLLNNKINSLSGYVNDTFISGSGITNYVPRWNTSKELVTGSIYDLGTGVGIGITNASSKLEVVHDSTAVTPALYVKGGFAGNAIARFERIYGVTPTTTYVDINGNGGNAQLSIATSNNTFALGVNNTTSAFEISDNSAIGTNTRLLIDFNGRVGISTTSPTTLLSVGGAGSTSAASGLTFGGDSTANLYRSAAGALKIDGSLGIGINPVQKFQVDGTVGNPASVGTTQSGIFRISNTTDNAVIDFGIRGGGLGGWIQSTDETSLSATYPLLLNPNGGYVGIGITTPSGQLHLRNMGFTAQSGIPDTNSYPNATGVFGLVLDHDAYTNGQYRHRFIKVDRSANIPLYLQQAGGTANQYINLVRFGAHSQSSDTFEVFGDSKINGTVNITSNLLVSGNIGIGTASPSYKLDAIGSIRASGELISEGNNARLSLFRLGGINYFDWASGQSLYFSTQSSVGGGGRSTLMTITSGGNVGIGTTIPAYKLDVNGSAGFTNGITANIDASSTSYFIGANGTRPIIFQNNTASAYDFGFKFTDLNTFTLVGGNTLANPATDLVSFTYDGKVGIGLTTPTSKLHVVETTATGTRIQLGSSIENALMNSGSTNNLLILNAPYGTNSSTTSNIGAKWGIKFVGSNEANQIDTVGKTSAIYAVSEDALGYNRGTSLAFYTNQLIDQTYAERMRIYHNGNIGIGVTNPSDKLQISGNVSLTTSTGLAVPMLGILPTNAAYVGPYNTATDGNAPTLLLFNHGASVQQIYFYSSGRAAMVLNRQGRLNIAGNLGNTPPALLNVGPSSSVDAVSGMSFGNDSSANLYRSAASTIKTDGSLEVVGTATLGSTVVNGGTLATSPAGSTLVGFNYNVNVGSNISQLNLVETRFVTGADWLSASTKIQKRVDAVNLAYIEFNPSGATNGMAFGVGFATQTEAMRILSNGNIGIGITNPVSRLDVNGTISISGYPLADRFAVYNRLWNPELPSIYLGDSSDPSNYYDNTTHIFRARGAGAERMRITSAGNVGIGTVVASRRIHAYTATGPVMRLESSGSNASIEFAPSLAGNGLYNWLVGAQQNISNAFEITPSTAVNGTTFSNPALLITSAGNVGIGTTVPTGVLTVHSNGTQLRLQTASGPGSYFATISSIYDSSHPFTIAVANNSASTTEFFGIYADGGGANNRSVFPNGNVGIGTTSPSGKLDVDVGAGGFAYFRSTSYSNIVINGTSASAAVGGSQVFFQTTSNRNWIVGQRTDTVYSSANSFFIRDESASATRLTIDANGNVGIGTTNPVNKLDVIGGNNTRINLGNINDVNRGGKLEIISGSDTVKRFYVGTNSSVYNLSFGIDSIEKAIIDLNGNFGIGTASPTTLLSVGGAGSASAASGLTFGGDASANLYRSATSTIKTDGSLNVAVNATFAGNVGIGLTTPAFKLDVSGGNARFSDYIIVGKDLAYPSNVNNAYLGYSSSVAYGPQSNLELIDALSNAIGVNDPLRFKTTISGQYFSGSNWYTDPSPLPYRDLLNGNANSYLDLVTSSEYSVGISGKRFVVDLADYYRRPNFILLNTDWNQAFWGFKLNVENSNDLISWANCITEQNFATNNTKGVIALSITDSIPGGISRYFRFSFVANQAISAGALRVNKIRSLGNQNYSSVIPVSTSSTGHLIASVGIISPTITSLSGNLATTGSTLDSKINSLSGYSNANFATITNLAATGSTLDTKINSLSGYAGNTFLSGVGVANYVPRWSGTKQLVTGSIYDNGANVGIGTTIPAYKLDVTNSITSRSAFNSPRFSSAGTYVYGVTNSPTWVIGNGSSTNNNATAPDGTTSAGTYTLSATSALQFDLYLTISGLTVGRVYTVGMWVKLGTATNFCLVVNNSIAWNTIGGKAFTSSDGLSTGKWTHISYTFTQPAGSNQINLHLGYHLETGVTQQTAGTVFLWNIEMTEFSSTWIGNVEDEIRLPGSSIWTSRGSVGIGTTVPANKLTVTTSTQYDGYYLRNTNGVVGTMLGVSATNDDGTVGLYSNTILKTNITANGVSYFNGGNVGIGVASPSTLLGVGGVGSTLPASGITFGGDASANLYRSAAGTLKTDGRLNIVGDATDATPDLFFNGAGGFGSAGGQVRAFSPDNTTLSWYWDNTQFTYNNFPVRIVNASSIVRVYLAPSSDSYINNSSNFGIGTNAPGTRLDVRFPTNPANDNGAGNNVLRVWTTAGYAADVGGAIGLGGEYSGGLLQSFGQIAGRKTNSISGNNAGYLQFSTTNNGGTMNEWMRIDAGGNVGIGTTNPLTKLHIYAAANGNNWTWFGGNVGATLPSAYTYGLLIGSNYSNGLSESNIVWGHGISNNQYFAIGKASGSASYSEQLRINQIGNVGINTTNPAAKLEVSGSLIAGGVDNGAVIFYRNTNPGTIGSTDTVLLVTDRSNSDWGIMVDKGGYDYGLRIETANSATNAFAIYNGSVYTARIYGNGGGYFLNNVGVGTSSPATLLSVGGPGSTTAASGITFGADNSANLYRLSTSTLKTDGNFTALGWISSSSYIYATTYLQAGNGNIYPGSFTQTLSLNVGNLAGNDWGTGVYIRQGTYVGIGTNTPSGKLHVVSSVAGETVLRADGTNGTLFSVTDDLSDSLMSVNNSAGLPVLEVFADDRVVAGQYGSGDLVIRNNKVGIGTSNPINKLSVVGNVSIGSNSYNISAPTNGLIVEGNVGIGTTSPDGKLSVLQSNTYSSFRSNGAGAYTYLSVGRTASELEMGVAGGFNQFFIGTAAGESVIKSLAGKMHLGYASNAPAITINTSNYVGLGTTNPVWSLDVSGTAVRSFASGAVEPGFIVDYASSNGYGGLFIHTNGVRKWRIGNVGDTDATSPALYIWQEGAGSRMYFRNNGNIGIATTIPIYTLDVSGTIRGERYRGINSLLLNTYATVNPASNVFLYSQANDRDSWIYLDSADTSSNWGIYHRQIDSAVSNLPANAIGFIGGGTSTLQSYISLTNGSAYFAGNVGIGTASPLQKFQVDGTVGNPALGGTTQTGIARISNTTDNACLDVGIRAAGSGAWLQSTDETDLSVYYPLLLNPNGGNVGVGTSAPLTVLDVRYKNTNNAASQVAGMTLRTNQNGGLEWHLNQTSLGYVGWVAGARVNSYGGNWGQGYLEFITAGAGGNISSTMTLNSGQVGIGITNPTTLLNVGGAGSTIAASGLTFGADVSANLYRSAASTIKTDGSLVVNGNFSTNTTTVTTLNINAGLLPGIPAGSTITGFTYAVNNGNVSQINLVETRFATGGDWTTASTKIQKRTDVTNQGYIEFNPSGSNYGMAFGVGANSNVEAMRIASNGTIGIGITSTSYKLQVNGSFAATTKSFDIVHPTISGKRLTYASLEGPENGVYYRGQGNNNEISLPHYWSGLVHDDSITVNLTAVGRRKDGKIRNYSVDQIGHNKVYIYTDSDDNIYNYYYTIFAERKDVSKLVIERDME